MNSSAITYSLGEIAERFGGEVLGDARIRIARVATLETAGAEAISFLANERYSHQLKTTGAAAVIVGPAARHAVDKPRIVTANPYLYFASQIYCGLDGLQRKLPLPPSADTPYEAKADYLPRTLGEAIQCLRDNEVLKQGLGASFVDYYCRIKEAEVARFNLEVSDWEHREYFDLF